MNMKYVYGPIPSRRLGRSLGISPIEKKTCNLSCVYCQLGLTDKMTNSYVNTINYLDIIDELKYFLNKNIDFDCISIVGEGEPTLYYDLDLLIKSIKKISKKPICVITNGTFLTEEKVYNALLLTDIVLPSIDAYDKASFKKINRPHKDLEYDLIVESLIRFSKEYTGQIWLEIMLCLGYNDDFVAIESFKELLGRIRYDKLYLNSPIRPPAIETVKPLEQIDMERIAQDLKGISIDVLAKPNFYSAINDDYLALRSIISRHPMNQYEIECFLKTRHNCKIDDVFSKLENDLKIDKIDYKGFITYRFKVGENYEV